MFDKTKEKLNSYFEEHPTVKKGLKVVGGLLLIGGGAYGGYKVGRKLERVEWNNLTKTLVANGQLIPKMEPLPEKVHEAVETVKDKILAPDDHTFDVTFTDTEDGRRFIAKDYCLGSYVNDCLSGMGMEYEVLDAVEDAAKEVVQEAAEVVTDAVTE
jgi:uncharacterized protein YgfB (UPF0149 family)